MYPSPPPQVADNRTSNTDMSMGMVKFEEGFELGGMGMGMGIMPVGLME